MKRLIMILAALALGLPGAAHACLGKRWERYIVLHNPPARLPEGAVLIRIRLLSSPEEYPGFFKDGAAARILAGPGAGRTVRLKPRSWSSCSRWIEKDVTGYVVGWAEGDGDRPASIEPMEYHARIYREPDEENSVGYKRTEVK